MKKMSIMCFCFMLSFCSIANAKDKKQYDDISCVIATDVFGNVISGDKFLESSSCKLEGHAVVCYKNILYYTYYRSLAPVINEKTLQFVRCKKIK